jgi:hypothetical protein
MYSTLKNNLQNRTSNEKKDGDKEKYLTVNDKLKIPSKSYEFYTCIRRESDA